MIFGPDLLVVLIAFIFVLGFLGISIWAIIDVSSHSKEDFDSAGSSKTVWIILIAVFTVAYGFGSLIAIYYLLRVRPKVLKVEGQALGGVNRPGNSGGSPAWERGWNHGKEANWVQEVSV